MGKSYFFVNKYFRNLIQITVKTTPDGIETFFSRNDKFLAYITANRGKTFCMDEYIKHHCLLEV